MPLIPFERIDIASPLSPDEAAAAISAALAPPPELLHRQWSELDFEGSFVDGELRCCKIIRYQSSFRPLIVARLEPGPAGTSRLRGVMRLHTGVAAFAVGWCLLVISMGLPFTVQTLSGPGNRALALVPLGLLVFMWAMAAGGFSAESGASRAALERILQASPATT